jgi:hypothetical protein
LSFPAAVVIPNNPALVIVLIALFAIVLLVPTVLIFIAVITPVSAFHTKCISLNGFRTIPASVFTQPAMVAVHTVMKSYFIIVDYTSY